MPNYRALKARLIEAAEIRTFAENAYASRLNRLTAKESIMKKWTDVPAGQVNAATQRLLVAMGDEADVIVDKIVADDGLAARLMKFALTGGYEPSTSHVCARGIMGKNMLGPDVAIKHFGIQATKQELAALSEIPFSEETLVACKDTHILVAVPVPSILAIRNGVAKTKLSNGQKSLFYKQDWYDKEAFAKAKGEFRWHLVRKTPVDNSTGKNWDEQQALLGKDEETPSAQVMVYTIIAYFLVTGERLFEGVYVRCSDLSTRTATVSAVGCFVAVGLRVGNSWDSVRDDRLGVASARK